MYELTIKNCRLAFGRFAYDLPMKYRPTWHVVLRSAIHETQALLAVCALR